MAVAAALTFTLTVCDDGAPLPGPSESATGVSPDEKPVPYYVTMAYISRGGGAEPWITTWGREASALVGPGQRAQSVNIVDDRFARCPGVDKSVPSGPFKKGTTDRPCDVYVAPEGKPLYVQWGDEVENLKASFVWKVVE